MSALGTATQYASAMAKRRTIYSLGAKLPMKESEVATTIKSVVRESPSAFNSQSSRVVILFGAEHTKVWDTVKEKLKALGMPPERYAESEAKVNNCFASGAGTVLFYEDQNTVKNLQEQFPLYANNFPTFAEHSSAMAQYAVWCALAQAGIGASLQHYNELIEPALRAAFGIPESWKLIAQMPFGSIEKPADTKTFIPDETRFKVLGVKE